MDSSYSSAVNMLVVVDEGNNIYAYDNNLKAVDCQADREINSVKLTP